MKSYAVVDTTINEVVNTIYWDGETPYEVAEGCILIDIGDQPVSLGWTYVDGEFIAPPPPPPVKTTIDGGPSVVA